MPWHSSPLSQEVAARKSAGSGGYPSSQAVGRAPEAPPSIKQSISSVSDKTKSIFLQHARLTKPQFHQAVGEGTKQNLSGSVFENLIYRCYTENSSNEAKGVAAEGLQKAMDTVRVCEFGYGKCITAYPAFKENGVPAEGYPALLGCLIAVFAETGATSKEFAAGCMAILQKAKEGGNAIDLSESFDRYDSDGSGTLDLNESIAMGVAVLYMSQAFMKTGQGQPLTFANYNKAIEALGFADSAKLMQGMFHNRMYEMLDTGGDGTIELAEFWKGVGRLLRPVRWEQQLMHINGWPGWHTLQRDELSRRIATLQTGDVVLTHLEGWMGQFLQFGTQSPWSHAAVVVRHAARPGEANAETEEHLQKHPFRRRGHVFCSPGYCRCFDQSWTDQYCNSALQGEGVSLLESTGEGVHVYDFGHRMFESAFSPRIKVGCVRRLSGVKNQNDVARVEQFVQTVRGHLYTTDTNQLKGAMERNAQQNELDKSSAFCSQTIIAFYKHMGWLEQGESTLVMPCDFDDPEGSTFPPKGSPVRFVGGGKLGPVEIIISKENA